MSVRKQKMAVESSSVPPSPAGSLYSPFRPGPDDEQHVPFSTSIYSPLRVGGRYVDAFASVVDDDDDDEVDQLHAEAASESSDAATLPASVPSGAIRGQGGGRATAAAAPSSFRPPRPKPRSSRR